MMGFPNKNQINTKTHFFFQGNINRRTIDFYSSKVDFFLYYFYICCCVNKILKP